MKQQTTQKTKANGAQVRVWLDLCMFAGMVLVLAPQATGIAVHEWASFLFIVVAAAIVMFLIAPLDQTQWAAGMRAGASSDVDEGVEGSGPGGAIRFIGPLLKIAILMGVPALVTLGIRGLLRRFLHKAEQE